MLYKYNTIPGSEQKANIMYIHTPRRQGISLNYARRYRFYIVSRDMHEI